MSRAFCGWYFKCQSGNHTVAVIPAFHQGEGERSCSIQLVTEKGAWCLPYPFGQVYRQGNVPHVTIGGSLFCQSGLQLDLHGEGIEAVGSLQFGALTPLRYDIMGPFRYLPFMECRHRVFSMQHAVNGSLWINGEKLSFADGVGYIEGDRGRSFPTRYAWTQCSFKGGSLMLSVADIPLGPLRFTGVIGVVYWQGREYRLATYLGARALRIQDGQMVVRQGSSILKAQLLEKNAHPLMAPQGGAMTRIIRESPACQAAYSFQAGGETLFSFQSSAAAFEYEYPS